LVVVLNYRRAHSLVPSSKAVFGKKWSCKRTTQHWPQGWITSWIGMMLTDLRNKTMADIAIHRVYLRLEILILNECFYSSALHYLTLCDHLPVWLSVPVCCGMCSAREHACALAKPLLLSTTVDVLAVKDGQRQLLPE
jgi:hypothetical protein